MLLKCPQLAAMLSSVNTNKVIINIIIIIIIINFIIIIIIIITIIIIIMTSYSTVKTINKNCVNWSFFIYSFIYLLFFLLKGWFQFLRRSTPRITSGRKWLLLHKDWE